MSQLEKHKYDDKIFQVTSDNFHWMEFKPKYGMI